MAASRSEWPGVPGVRVHAQHGASGLCAQGAEGVAQTLAEIAQRLAELERRVAPPLRSPFVSLAELADRWRCTPREARVRCRRHRIARTRPAGARSDLVRLSDVIAVEERRTEV